MRPYLGQGQSSGLSQAELLIGARIAAALIQVHEGSSHAFLEAVDDLISIPDSARQGVLLPQPVLVHCTQRSVTRLQ